MKLFHAIANYMSGFFNNDLEPWLKNLGNEVAHDIVTVLAPIAQTVVQELLDAGKQLLAGGDPTAILANTLTAVEKTGTAALEATIQATGQDLLTAVAAAISTAQATANATSPAVSTPTAS